MHGSHEGTKIANRLQRAGIASTAGMQDDLAAELFAADMSEFPGSFQNRIIGDRNENDSGRQALRRNARERTAGTNKLHGFAGASLGTRGDYRDAPAAF